MGVLDFRRGASEEGFSLLETLTAVSLLAMGLFSLAAVFTMALSRTTNASWDMLAKEKAAEAIENILAARDSGRLVWDDINNVGTGSGKFLTGARALVLPGNDRLVNTEDDTTTAETVRRPGPNGNMGDADDEVIPLSHFTREVVIGLVPNTPGNTLREIRVIVRYRIGGMSRQVVMSSYVSSFTG
jgi:type II secretory pathway pseudopilin PulG